MPRTPSRIHRGLTGARELVGARYLADPELRREYVQEIAPRTGAALDKILAHVALPPPRRVLDVGAGTGAASQAVRARWPAAELVAVDRVPGPGILTADVTRGARPKGVAGTFDLIVAAHLLNELALDADARARLVGAWCRELLDAAGTCILVEPALRDTSRALLAVRDRVRAAGLFVVAPCVLQEPCPALARERDFCHDSAGVIAQGRSRVDFSYLVLQRQGSADLDPSRFRVVSDAMKDKGRLRLFLCGAPGRVLVTRLDRDRCAGNEALDQVVRGDQVRVESPVAQSDGLRCTRETVVTRLGTM